MKFTQGQIIIMGVMIIIVAGIMVVLYTSSVENKRNKMYKKYARKLYIKRRAEMNRKSKLEERKKMIKRKKKLIASKKAMKSAALSTTSTCNPKRAIRKSYTPSPVMGI